MVLATLFALFLFLDTIAAEHKQLTDFIRYDKSATYPLLSFINSTSKVYRVGLHLETEASLFSISSDSSFFLDSSTLVSYGSFIPFTLSGHLELSSISFSLLNEHSSIGSLTSTPSPLVVSDPTASIALSSSSLSNMPMSSNFGTFVSTGLTSMQNVDRCMFSNITIYDSSETGMLTLSENCRFDNSVIKDSQDTFYGLIITGASPKTTSAFSCLNSTFATSVRQSPISPEALHHAMSNENCGSTPQDGSTTTGQSYTCRLSLSTTYSSGGSYNFTNCVFQATSSATTGAAVYLASSSYSNPSLLRFTGCEISSCHSSQHGGAVTCLSVRQFEMTGCTVKNNYVEGTQFVYSTSVHHDAGAILINSSRVAYVGSTTFTENRTPSRGGALYLGNVQQQQAGHIIEGCTFTGNTAQYDVVDAEGNKLPYIAGIGGGMYTLPHDYVSIANCLYYKNVAGWHGAGLVYSLASFPSKPTFCWLIFRENTAPQGRDIYVRMSRMPSSLCDAWTFHDSYVYPAETNRYQYNTTTDEKSHEHNDTFLSVGPAMYVNTNNAISRNETSCREYYYTTNCKTLSDVIGQMRSDSTDPTLATVGTARLYLVAAANHYETTSIDVGTRILYIQPYTPSSSTSTPTVMTINSTFTSDDAVFKISSGYALLYSFTIDVAKVMSKPLAAITNAGHLACYGMTLKSTSSLEHTSSILSAGTGDLLISNTNIFDFTLQNAPLITFDNEIKFTIRFVGTSLISNIERKTGSGSVFEVTYASGTRSNIIISGLQCQNCKSAVNGGAVAVTLGASDAEAAKVLTLTGCSFTDCSSAESSDVMKGGAVYVNILDTSSTIQIINSHFSSSAATKYQGHYVYIDCKDGEFVGAQANWKDTLTVDLAASEFIYYWLDSNVDNTTNRKHYSQSLYYFVFSPSDAGKQEMIVDVATGADIRTCGWPTTFIPCATIKRAFDQRGSIVNIKPTYSSNSDNNKYTTGTVQFIVTSYDLTIAGASSSEKPNIVIDAWTSTSPIFQLRDKKTTLSNVKVTVTKSISAQFMYIPYRAVVSDENPQYTGSLVLDTVEVAQEGDILISNYFLRATRGDITLKAVTATGLKFKNNCFVGVSTSAHKSTLVFDGCTFDGVTSTGKGSVLSLTASCFAAITFSGTTTTFKDCTSGDDYGAIYDTQALTDDTKSVVDKSTTFTFTTTPTFTKTKDSTKQFAYFEEPGWFIFKTDTTGLVPQWTGLLGYSSTNTYTAFSADEDFFMVKACGYTDGTTVVEPPEPFSLVHVLFKPEDAGQTNFYVAGKVGDVPYYFDSSNTDYQNNVCGWEDIPCKTIGQAVYHQKGNEEIILISSHTHIAEPETLNIHYTVTIKSNSETTFVTKPVTKPSDSTSTTTIDILNSAAATFKLIQFVLTENLERNFIRVQAGSSLTLTNTSFISSSELVITKPLIYLPEQAAHKLTINSASFSSNLSYDWEGGYISITCTHGTTYTPASASDTSLTNFFSKSDATNPTICNQYWVTETGGASASLLHWIYAPQATSADLMYVDGTSKTPEGATTCGWSDLPCKKLSEAITNRGNIETVQIDGATTLDKTFIQQNANHQLIIAGKSGDTLQTLTIPSVSRTAAETAIITNEKTLKFSELTVQLTATELATGLTAVLSSSSLLSFQDMTFKTEGSTVTFYVLSIFGGSLSVIRSTFQDFSLSSHPLFDVTAPTAAVEIVFTVSTFKNIKNTNDNVAIQPALLQTPATYDDNTPIKITLSNDTFEECQSPHSTQGGAIYFTAGVKSQINIDTSILQQCTCNTASGKGGFLYINCLLTGAGNYLGFSIRTVTCNNNDAHIGKALFIDCDDLDKRILPSMFTVLLDDTHSTSYYSFWGAQYRPEDNTMTAVQDESLDNGHTIDLLKKFDQYGSTEIYVQHGSGYAGGAAGAVGYPEKECGPHDKPCLNIHDGANHLLPSKNSHIYLLTSTPNCVFKEQTTLSNLMISGEFTGTVTPTSPEKFALTVSEAVNSLIQISGEVTVLRIDFTLNTASGDGPLFAVSTSSVLSLTESSFAGTSLAFTLVSLAQSSLILNAVTLSDTSFTSAGCFVTADGLSASSPDTVSLTSCVFTDVTWTSTKPFISTTNGATLSCSGTKFTFTKDASLYSIFTLEGEGVIENTEISKSAGTVTLGADLISTSAPLTMKTTTQQHTNNDPTATIISGLTLSTYSLVSGAGRLTLDGCTFKDLVHSDGSAKSLFATTFTVKGCTFDSITSGDIALLTPTSGAVTITESNFTFTEGNLKSLLKIEGGSELETCEFRHTTKGASISASGTLVTIESGDNTVTITSCEFTSISSTSATVIVARPPVVLNHVTLTFTQTAELTGGFISSTKNIIIVESTFGKVKTAGLSNAVTVPTLKGSLFSSDTTLVLNKTTVSDLTAYTDKAILASPSITIDDKCQFTSISASGTGYPVLFPSASATTSLTIANSDFTFSNLYLLVLTKAATIKNCNFESSASLTVAPIQVTAAVTVTFDNCKFKNMQSSDSLIKSSAAANIVLDSVIFTTNTDAKTFVNTQGSVQMNSCKMEVTGKYAATFISAKTGVTLDNCKFTGLDHSTSTHTLFADTFTITDCEFTSINQATATGVRGNTAVAPLLKPTSGPVSVTNTLFTFTAPMQNMMTLYGGSEIRECTFSHNTADTKISISNTLITIEDGTEQVTLASCRFVLIDSTPAAVIDCKASVKVVLEDVSLTFATDASLNAFVVTQGTEMEFRECQIVPAEGQGTATLNSALITVLAKGNLILSNTNITDLTVKGEDSCIITTQKEGDAAASILIDTCSFANVKQDTTSVPKIPIFNTPLLTTFKITSCQFDSVEQAVDNYLLSAPKATSFTLTDTKFYLPAALTHSLLEVTKVVTFSGCTFSRSSQTAADATTLTAPLIQATSDRTDISFISCSFSYLRALTTTGKDGKEVRVPAIVELGDTVTLSAINCSFTNVSSEIRVGQVFNAKASASFDKCEFTETLVPEDDGSVEEVCYWNASIVQLGGGDCTLTDTLFHNISAGALGISGGANVRINKWDFKENHPVRLTGFEKMYRNVNCTELSTLSINDESITPSTSLYLISDHCTINYAKPEQVPTSTFFVPTLTSCATDPPQVISTLTLTFSGENLIPCGLSFQIFLDTQDPETDEPAYTNPVEVPGTGSPTSRSNEVDYTTQISQTVDLSNTPELYDKKADKVRLAYGEGQYTECVEMKPAVSFPTARVAQGGSTETEPEEDKFKWWYWLLIGIGAFLLLVIILLICCCCCKDEEEKEEEDEEEDMETVKTMNTAALMALNTKELLPNTAFKDFDANKVVSVESMHTTEPYERAVISAKKSLYSQIHSPTHRQDHNPFMWTAAITFHICHGIQHILDVLYENQPAGSTEVSADVMKNILNTLCPHNIFVDDRDAILLGSVPNSYQVPVSVNAKEGKTDFQLECQRYRSPEMTSHPTDDSRQMKESNAVYAIGFIMYEIFTGWLVFDGYDYSRVAEMVASGARPDLVLVRSVDSNFASIIESATAMEAETRPSIAQLLEKIDMYLPNELRKGGAQHIMRASMMDDDDL